MVEKLAGRTALARHCLVLGLVAAVVSAATRPALAHHPSDDHVKQIVRRAVGYIENQKHSFITGEKKLGADCLLGLALLAADAAKAIDIDETHPLIKKAIETCKKDVPGYKGDGSGNEMYAPAIALIFLCDMEKLEPGKYREHIQTLVKYVLRRQQRLGGWGYITDTRTSRGDTSQTQYCVLGLWAADQMDFKVPPEAMAEAVKWLMRTQDPTGGWGYKGVEPAGGAARAKQQPLTGSLASAGLGSVYVASEFLGFTGLTKKDATHDPDLPPDVKYYIPDREAVEKKEGPRSDLVAAGPLSACQEAGNAWFRKNFNIINKQPGREPESLESKYQYYYMYALERYRAFRMKAENDTTREPDWYNQGVDYLAKKQNGSGGWESQTPVVDAAFAILFLTRSTATKVNPLQLAEGRLKGTGKLPTEGGIIERNGKLYGEKISKSAGDLLDAIDASSEEEFQIRLDEAAEITFAKDESERARQARELRKLVSHKDYKARILAVKGLAKERNIESVPALIYALSDPDPRVIQAARNALRYISRKFDGFGLVDEPTDIQQQEAQRKWKQWYLALRPDAVFVD